MARIRTAAVRVLLADRGFRRLYGTRLLSQCSDGIFQVSLATAVLFSPERQADAALVALGFTVLLLPYSLVGPFAGVLLDRWSRSRILVRANLVRAALVVAVAAVLSAAGPTGPAFTLLALAVISVNRFFLATLSAGLPRLVPADRLVTANALSVTSGTLIAIVGAGIGVALRGSGTDRATAAVALLAGAGYVASALLARGFAVHRLGPDERPVGRTLRSDLAAVAAGMVAGARHVRERGPAARALAAISASRFLFGFTTLLTLLVYRNHLTDGHWLRGGLPGLTQVVVLSGVGTVTGALLTPPVVARTGKPVWITAVLLLGAGTMLAFGLPYTKASFLVAGLVLGFLQQAIKICVDTTVQEQVDDDFRGRVFSFYDTLFNVSFVASAALAAAFLPADGVSRTAIVGVAAGYLVTAVAFAVGSRRSAGVAG